MTIETPETKLASGQGKARTLEQHWSLTYHHAMGETVSHFFDVLREQGELHGRRCPSCERVLLPPRAFCDRCFVSTTDWVCCGTTGTLQAFTVVSENFKGSPKAPYCFGYVLLDGASTAILNYVDGVNLDDVDTAARSLHVGMPVKLVINSERSGSMSDFRFELE